MCRMYASLGGQGPTAEEVRSFGQLCTTGCGGPHADGWGIVGFPSPGTPRYLGRAPSSAEQDPAFGQAAKLAEGYPVVVAHLRHASVGAKSLENTHPFCMGGWAFAHNGTIRGGYEQRFGTPGMNDSRALFARIHQRLGEGKGADALPAVRAALREVRELAFPYTSMTVLLTDGRSILAARDVREREDEYAMRWAEVEGRLVFCQEPIFPGKWEDVPNGKVAVATARGVRIEPL